MKCIISLTDPFLTPFSWCLRGVLIARTGGVHGDDDTFLCLEPILDPILTPTTQLDHQGGNSWFDPKRRSHFQNIPPTFWSVGFF